MAWHLDPQITQITLGIMTLGSSLLAWFTAHRAKKNGKETTAAVQEIHLQINSRFDQWMREHGDAERAKGELIGIAKATIGAENKIAPKE